MTVLLIDQASSRGEGGLAGVTVADRPVDPRDAASTAHAVWQLISLLMA